MTTTDRLIYLASRSPRRRELLKQIGVGFELLLVREDGRRGPDVDETPQPGEDPVGYVLRMARIKAQAALKSLAHRKLAVPRPILSADTTVVLDERILGKPADEAEAYEMLQMLSGRTHQVLTAVAMCRPDRMEARLSVTTVELRELTPAEIRHYVASGEPMDKAGAYGVQGRAGAFVRRLEGSYTGVMGLPLFETAELLALFERPVL